MIHNIVIIGSGPAGYCAAIYAQRAGLNPIVITGLEKGGQLMQTTDVENYPGFVNILGPTLMLNMEEQLRKLHVPIIADYIKDVNFTESPYELIGEKEIYKTKTVIIATGSSAKWLGAKGEDEFKGFGVSSCATCDGFFFKNQTVAVIGGGNTAMEEALYLSAIAEKVYLIHRRDALRGEKIIQDRVFKNSKIEIIWNHELEEIVGVDDPKTVKSIILKEKGTSEIKSLNVNGVFIAIGHNPNTSFLKGKIDLDTDGYINTNINTCLINGKPQEGIYAAGDIRDKIYKQAVTSAGTGCQSALDAQHFLQKNN